MLAEPPCVLLLYRAILTLRALPDPEARYFQIGSTWPIYARRYLDAYDPDHETEIHWQPTPQDVSAYLAVLNWGRNLTRRGWDIMRLRARDYSLELIADMLRTSIDQIEHDHADAVSTIIAASGASPIDNPPALVHQPRRHHCA